MAFSPPQIALVGCQTAVRPLLAAVALRPVLDNAVTVVAMSAVDAQTMQRATALVMRAGLQAPSLQPCDVRDGPPACDLLIATDLGDSSRDCQARVQAPAGGYLLTWDGPEPTTTAQVLTVLAEMTRWATDVQLDGLLQLAGHRGRASSPKPSSEAPRPQARRRSLRHEIIGKTLVMQALLRRVAKIASHTGPVLIQGETGTGKDLVAAAIHDQSARANQPFVAFNCALTGSELAESELFGHARGAYTGAQEARRGLFRSADGGTLFLDEIAELPLGVQAKLLRALETKQIRPVGSDREHSVDVRLVAATHRDLLAGVRAGWFREDLYHRLAVGIVVVPPLRDRIEDLPLLTDHLLDQLRRETGRHYEPVSSVVMDTWRAYHWPGNVRELRNLLYRAVMDASGAELPVAALLPDQASQGATILRTHPRKGQRVLNVVQVADALRKTAGNRSVAAQLLAVSRATLHRFLREHPELDR